VANPTTRLIAETIRDRGKTRKIPYNFMTSKKRHKRHISKRLRRSYEKSCVTKDGMGACNRNWGTGKAK